MVISFHGSLTGASRLRWDEAIHIAADAGFGALDLDVAQLGLDDDPAAIRCRLDAAGLQGGAGPLPIEMREDDTTFRAGMALFERRLEAAATIGIRVLHRSLPASSDRPVAELVPILRDRWRTMADRARPYGIVLAVEPLGTLYRRTAAAHDGIWRLDDATTFARSCGEGVGVLVDSWHWHLAGSSAADIVAAGSDIAHVHVADVPRRPTEDLCDTERVLPNDGAVDFDEFMYGLIAAGYDGLVSPEVPGSWTVGVAPREGARRGMSATRGVLARPTASVRSSARSRGGGGGGGGGGAPAWRHDPGSSASDLPGGPR